MDTPRWLKIVWTFIVVVGGAMLVDLALEHRWVDCFCSCCIAYATVIFVLDEFSDARPRDRE